MIVHVAEPLRPFAELSVTRLRYLYPSASFTLTQDGIEVGGNTRLSQEALSREIHYALYREKIYAETLSMRRGLIEAVTQ